MNAGRSPLETTQPVTGFGRRMPLRDGATPLAYKDIHKVTADQSDLTAVVHVLHQVLNYEGTRLTRKSRPGPFETMDLGP